MVLHLKVFPKVVLLLKAKTEDMDLRLKLSFGSITTGGGLEQ